MRIASLLAVVVLLVVAPAPGASAHDLGCIGVGPALFTCTTGTHIFNTEYAHGMDLEASQLFTGGLESWMIWGLTGVRRIRCEIVLGKIQGSCVRDGFFDPAHGEPFQHLCYSYFLGTDTQGGIGPWGCKISHD